MALFSKDRNLSVALDRVELDVRASDYQLKRGELDLSETTSTTSVEESLSKFRTGGSLSRHRRPKCRRRGVHEILLDAYG